MSWEQQISRKRSLKALDALGLQLANREHCWTGSERLAFDRKVRRLKDREWVCIVKEDVPIVSAFWNPERTKAACILGGGGTQDEAALEAGVTDRTIRNWLQDEQFAAEVDRLSLMVGISSRAERLRLAMRVVRQKTAGNEVKTDKDVLEWLKFAQSETDGVKLDITKLAAALGENEASVAAGGQAGVGGESASKELVN